MAWFRNLLRRLRAGAEASSATPDSGSRPDAVGVALATDELADEPVSTDESKDA